MSEQQWQEMAARVARAEDRTMSAEAEAEALREKLSSVTEDYIKERNAATAAEAERDALRLDLAAFRATALETSNHMHDVIRERDALRLAVAKLEDERKFWAGGDAMARLKANDLRAEVERLERARLRSGDWLTLDKLDAEVAAAKDGQIEALRENVDLLAEVSRSHAAILALTGEVERLRAVLEQAREDLRQLDGDYWQVSASKAEAERDALRLDLAEACRGAAVLARERNEAQVERDALRIDLQTADDQLRALRLLTSPTDYDMYLKVREDALREGKAERDALRAAHHDAAAQWQEEAGLRREAQGEAERLRAEAFDATHAFAMSVREAEELHAEVERRKALAAATQLECNRLAADLSRTLAEVERPFRERIEQAEAALRRVDEALSRNIPYMEKVHAVIAALPAPSQPCDRCDGGGLIAAGLPSDGPIPCPECAPAQRGYAPTDALGDARAEAAEPRCVRCGSPYTAGGACSRSAEGCQGGRGEWTTFIAPACPYGHPPGSARDCACHTEERHWQDDADPNPGRAQAAYQAEREREKP